MLLNPDGKKYYYHDNISYIEVPVLFMFHYKKLYLGAGPALSFKVSSWIKAEGRRNKTDYYKATDLSSNVLFGWQVANKVAVNLRYSHGVLDVSEGLFVAKNRLLNFSLLYRLNKAHPR
jgi:hypothetical protein